MRYIDIKNKYTSTESKQKVFNDDLFIIGDQLAYEWEKDFTAMKFALKRLKHEIDKDRLHPLRQAYDELLKRVSEYSCPNIIREGESCPLNNLCRYPECKAGSNAV